MIEKYTNGAWAELGKYRKYGTENYDVSTFPASMLTTGNDFEDYRIYGAVGGTGEQTENILDGNDDSQFINNTNISQPNSWVKYDGIAKVLRVACRPATTYTLKIFGDMTENAVWRVSLCSSDNIPSDNERVVTSTIIHTNEYTPTTISTSSTTKYILIQVSFAYNDTLLETLTITEGSTAPTQYIPYGYQLNAVVGDGVTTTEIPIYIGSTPLEQGEYVDYGEQKIYKYIDGILTPTDPPVAFPTIPTLDGTTIVDFDNSPKPDRMTADDTGWFGHTLKIYTNGQWVDMT